MSRINIQETAWKLAAQIVEKHAFELVDVEFVKEGAHWYLRVYIDKPSGITIDDCQVVSEEMSEKLDSADPIEQSYFLEVSSPGLDRPLKTERDFEKYKGELVEVKVYQPIDGKKVFEGELVGLVNNVVEIKPSQDEVLSFNRDKVATVRRVIKF